MAGKGTKKKDEVFKIDTEGMSFADVVHKVVKGGEAKPSTKGKRKKKEAK
jgi:hypothetical protein